MPLVLCLAEWITGAKAPCNVCWCTVVRAEASACRFGIPFGLATSLGLAVRALDLPLTITEAGDGNSSMPLCTLFYNTQNWTLMTCCLHYLLASLSASFQHIWTHHDYVAE